MEGVQQLLRVKVVVAGITPPEGFRLHREADPILYTGWDGPAQERFAQQFIPGELHLQDPAFQHFLRISKPNITVRPLRLLPARVLRASDAYALRTRVLGIEDFMFSQRAGKTGRA